jgi:hypothetical protein
MGSVVSEEVAWSVEVSINAAINAKGEPGQNRAVLSLGGLFQL